MRFPPPQTYIHMNNSSSRRRAHSYRYLRQNERAADAARRERRSARRRLRRRREHTHPVWVLRRRWAQARLRVAFEGMVGVCVRLARRALTAFSFVPVRSPAHRPGIPRQARTPASRPSDPSRALWVARSRTSSTRPAFCSVRGSSRDYFPAPVPYRDVTLPETLRFGYYLNDGAVEGSLACHRAVLETAEVLRKTGHECFEIEPDSTQALRLFTGIKSD
ncbi:hypothetical protein BC826DRAFT_1109084 [Russula brevipes]|nr:hypothetical protein BC826DRAFT_1109084 [Russula brevipes]